jgi:hypothetical protein
MPTSEEQPAAATPTPGVDFKAVARVAQRVDLREIRLAEIAAVALPRIKGPLEPNVTHNCTPTRREGGALEVSCDYSFTATVAETEVAKATVKFLISYELEGEDPFSDADIQQFAFANGTYHSWPFVRQLLFDLTARMGYAPYNLPVFKFNPKPPKPQAGAPLAPSPEAGEKPKVAGSAPQRKGSPKEPKKS